jgi:general secretion pathway protein F
MAGFEYQALDANGRTVKGVLEGDGERQVRAALRDKGLTPLKVEPIHTRTAAAAASGEAPRAFALRRRLSSGELALVTRQFATLIRAGLTIEDCLNVLIEQSETARVRTVLAGVRGRLLEGQSLHRSLAAFPDAFPEIYRAMVDSGEQSGKLGEVLERLADYSENREALRQKVLLAFIYPALVTIVAIGVISLLLVYVVPQVTRVFANTGQTLPWVTRVLIVISDFMRASAWLWVVGIAGGLIAAKLALRNEATRRRWHELLLKLPMIGRITRGLSAARFSDTLGILTASGVPLLNALQSSVAVISNLPMRAAVEDTVRQVREGGSLARSLGKAKLFPPLVIHLIASGEASGKLDQMLARAAEAQSRELEGWVRTLTALLEPLLILAMGLVVLFIVIAILLPIFEMNQLIK